jgi:putative heme-binding domain-containing protein
MPAANLPEDQAWQVVAFVRSLTSPAAENAIPGDPVAGEKVFAANGCANCHRINGKGGLLGPDLSNVAAVRALPDLRESVIDPDADGAQGYRAVTLTFKDGRTLKGVARNRSNYSVQVQDAKGNLHLVPMDSVTEMTIGRGSPMPKDYGKKIGQKDLDDLVSYLARQSIRPAEVAKK